MPIIQTVIRNPSEYPIDIIWENAQDLEHVAVLHGNTNHFFKLLHVHKNPGSKYPYDILIYRAVRKLFSLKTPSFGFRKIMGDYNIHQVEYMPLLNLTSALNSMLVETDDPKYPTILKDEVVMDIPFFLAPFEEYIFKSLRRHTAIQCAEDEPFRARRVELKKRGMNFPVRIFNISAFEEMTSLFKEKEFGRGIFEPLKKAVNQ